MGKSAKTSKDPHTQRRKPIAHPRRSRLPRGEAGDAPATSRRSTDGPQTVGLQPLAKADTEEHKLFGVALAKVMERQKRDHAELEIPLFFHLAGKLIQAQGKRLSPLSLSLCLDSVFLSLPFKRLTSLQVRTSRASSEFAESSGM